MADGFVPRTALLLFALLLLAAIALIIYYLSRCRSEPYEALADKDKASNHPTKTCTVSVPAGKSVRVVGGPDGAPVPVVFTYGGQHTIAWDVELSALPPGSCNLYTFPSVGGNELTDAPLAALSALVIGLCDAPEADVMSIPDSSGARLFHGLLIANNPPAINLCLSILTRRPSLMLLAHADGPFVGENCLHVLAVNRRQSHICRLLALATQHLADDQLDSLLNTPASGGMFGQPDQSPVPQHRSPQASQHGASARPHGTRALPNPRLAQASSLPSPCGRMAARPSATLPHSTPRVSSSCCSRTRASPDSSI